jgi:hypothetical protein
MLEGEQVTASQTKTCVSPIVVRNTTATGYTDLLIGCGSVVTSTTGFSTFDRRTNPYLTFGIGLEGNFGNVFARIEGELMSYLGVYNGSAREPSFFYTQFYNTRLTAAVGYRF